MHNLAEINVSTVPTPLREWPEMTGVGTMIMLHFFLFWKLVRSINPFSFPKMDDGIKNPEI
jgi:hypothetical protein